MNRIGKNIKKARSEKGYTQEQLAQKLCVTRNTISNYETGHSNPDIEMLQMLAEALKTDPNTLIYGEKKEQSADQTWRKEILKRVIWLVIAGLIIMISASLIQYGGEIAKDTLQVPMWSPWLNSVAYPIAYMIIGSQIMALVLQACGKRNSEYRWIKAGFLILVAACSFASQREISISHELSRTFAVVFIIMWVLFVIAMFVVPFVATVVKLIVEV